MASRLIRNQLPSRVAGSTPVSSATELSFFLEESCDGLPSKILKLRSIQHLGDEKGIERKSDILKSHRKHVSGRRTFRPLSTIQVATWNLKWAESEVG